MIFFLLGVAYGLTAAYTVLACARMRAGVEAQSAAYTRDLYAAAVLAGKQRVSR